MLIFFSFKQYDSTQTPLALLEQTCRSIGADTSSSKSSQSIDHTKKDHHHTNGSSHKMHLNGAYKPSSIAINQLANLANNYEGGRRSGNSSSEYARASVSPASANLAANGSSRPNSNNGNNSRPNSNNSGNSSLTSTKGKELSFKPYEEQRNRDKNNQRKHHSPELEHLKLMSKSDRKSSDSLNGLSPKNSINSFLPNPKQATTTTTSLNLSYAAQQQQLFESKLLEFQYQQYFATLAANSYPFNNNPSLIAAAALNNNPLLSRNSNVTHSSSSSNTSNNVSQQQQSIQQQQTLPPQQQLTPSQANSSITNCPPGCDSCIIHNPLLLSSLAAAQTPSSLPTANNNLFTAHHLAALAQQYPQIPPNFLYGLAGYPSLAGLTPPVSTPSSTSNSTALSSLTHPSASNATLNNLNASSGLNPLLNNSAHTNSNPLTMHQHSLPTSNHNSTASNKSGGPHFCTFMGLNNSICGKRFNTMDDYLIHLKSHSNPNDFHNNLNAASLESLYGTYEAMLASANNQAAQSLANLRRPTMHDTLSNSRYHPYNKPSSNNYQSQNNNSSAMLPPSNIPPFPLGALNGLNGLNNLSNLNGLNLPTNSSAAAASFNSMYYGAGRIGPTVQQ